jgi:hypothetical protein
VAEAFDLLAPGEFVQAVLVAPDLRAVARGEAAAVAVVMAVGEVDVLRRAVRREPLDAFPGTRGSISTGGSVALT